MFSRGWATLFWVAIFVVSAFFVKAEENRTEPIILSCETFQYEIDSHGKNLRFLDRTDGTDYLKTVPEEKTYCAYVEKGGEILYPASATFDGNLLGVTFSDGITSADIRVTNEKTRLILDVEKTTGDPDTLCFLNIPLTLSAIPNEPLAACALSLNLETHVYELPALHRNLWAASYKRFGLDKGRAAVIAVPQKEIIPVIRDVLTNAAPEIPLSDQGGAWALEAKEGYGSYFLQSGALTEQTVDEWIAACREIGFNQIDNHGSTKASFFAFGSMEINKERFPRGWKSFKNVIDRLHAAGISSILHTYTCYISPDSEFVTPVPHPNLDILSSFTLAEPLDESMTEFTVNESTADVSTAVGYMETSNRTLRIGDEIIQFNDVTRSAPYKFTGCVRGFHGTGVSRHTAGDSVGILKTFWSGLYVPDPKSPLFDEIARRTAEVVSDCGFDGVYFDAIEGLQYMWGKENYWYYGDKFIFEFMRNLKKPVGLEYAGMVHHWWNYRSRYQAWDMARRGYKRFMDIHIASMKAGQEYQHGSWGGSWADIQRFGPMKDYGLHLPLQLGWWSFRTWENPKTDAMFLDDVEYVCVKMLGNHAGFSMTRTDPATVASHPIFQRFIEMIARYEKLKNENYFSEEICAQLREPGKEFTLTREGDTWMFRPIFYGAHKTDASAEETLFWTLDSPYSEQSPKIRIEALASAEINTDAPLTLLDVTSLDGLKETFKADGVCCELTPSEERVPATSERAMKLTASSNGTSEKTATYARLTKILDSPIDYWAQNGALDVWVCGDGSGAVVDFSLYCKGSFMEENVASHYVILDFVGWRHFTLIEPESTRISDYRWPVLTKYYVYDHHIGNVYSVGELRIQVNHLPTDREVNCLIGPIHTQKMTTGKLVNPTLTMNGKRVTFPVTMETGMFLETDETGQTILYAPTSVPIETVTPVGIVPVLKSGVNDVVFASGETPIPSRARITFGVTGEALQ